MTAYAPPKNGQGVTRKESLSNFAKELCEQLFANTERPAASWPESAEGLSEFAIQVSVDKSRMNVVLSANSGRVAERFSDSRKYLLHNPLSRRQLLQRFFIVQHFRSYGGRLPGAEILRSKVMAGAF